MCNAFQGKYFKCNSQNVIQKYIIQMVKIFYKVIYYTKH